MSDRPNDVPSGGKPRRALVTRDAAAARAAFGPDGPLLGLDLGSRTIGLAVSDGLRMTATPLETLERKKFSQDAATLARLVAERGIVGFVLGLPVDMSGDSGKRVQITRAFARSLSEKLPQPIWLWDERLSTVAVERTLIEADASRKRRAEVVDKLAAAYILQGALDRLEAMARDDAEARDAETRDAGARDAGRHLSDPDEPQD